MKKFLQVLALSLAVVCIYGATDSVTSDNCAGKTQCPSRRRRLQLAGQDIAGPCSGFTYSKEKNPKCPTTPALNADMQTKSGLSVFARDWIDYTCCNIVSKPMEGIIPNVWMWLQVCTKAMNTARADPKVYALDDEYQKTMWKDDEKKSYFVGPLRVMKSYCPQDLDGGELTEWMVATFFPVMEKYNPNFKAFDEKSFDKFTPKQSAGAATVLLTKPDKTGTLGHIAMVIHKDHSLDLPEDHDTEHYVSFSNVGNTIGAMVTGTKAVHMGFGVELAAVTHSVTLYNADFDAMAKRWENIKQNKQMFDLMEWNCARIMLEVLQAGYPERDMPLAQLWTPERAYNFVKLVEPNVNAGAPKAKNGETLKAIHDRQIEPETRTIVKEIPTEHLVAVALSSFFCTLVIAGLAAGIVIMKMKADAAQELDRRLANLLISATSQNKPGATHIAGKKYQGSGPPSKQQPTKKNSVVPDSALCVTIQEEMDTVTKDGETDFEEFSEWAQNHKLTKQQAKMMWNDLDSNHDKHVTSKEWDEYIQKRPNLKWLVKRLQSCRRT